MTIDINFHWILDVDFRNILNLASNYNKYFKDFRIDENDLLYFKNRIVVPINMINEIIHDHHSIPICGHLGISKTIQRLSKNYFWLNFTKSIVNFIKNCLTCRQLKPNQRKNKAQLKPILTSYPFEMINMDIVGPLVRTVNGNRYILVVIDHFSKYVQAFALKNFTAFTTAKVILDKIICKYGTPSKICSDQGVNFESELFKHLCEMLQITKLRSTGYHPETNGEVERANKTIKSIMRMTR